MSVAEIYESFANWSIILSSVLVGEILTTIISILTISMTVGLVIYLFKRG